MRLRMLAAISSFVMDPDGMTLIGRLLRKVLPVIDRTSGDVNTIPIETPILSRRNTHPKIYILPIA
jgi:hypothetical protein